jgi:hypothetical protein
MQSGPDTLGKGRPAADEREPFTRGGPRRRAGLPRKDGSPSPSIRLGGGFVDGRAEWVLLASREEAHDLLGACFDGHDACVQFEGVRHVVKDLGVLASREAGRTVAA